MTAPGPPLSPELSKKLEPVFRVMVDQDNLAPGNLQGDKLLHNTLPATFGIPFTRWDLTSLA